MVESRGLASTYSGTRGSGLLGSYDVFLSHNTRDKPLVETLARRLLEHGLRPWLDKWSLLPGDPWQERLQAAIASIPAVLVCVGEHALGPWQTLEVRQALDAAVRDGTRIVVPVLLPGAGDVTQLRQTHAFLSHYSWLDLRDEAEWDLSSLVARIGRAEPGSDVHPRPSSGFCPYRGLESFQDGHGSWMFGREADERRVLAHLRDGSRFTLLAGASGSGKSSLVLAGVAPAVRTGALDGSYNWRVLVMRPGAAPCEELANALAYCENTHTPSLSAVQRTENKQRHRTKLLASNEWLADVAPMLSGATEQTRLLVIVDQFEEVFTEATSNAGPQSSPNHGGPNADAAAFIANLVHASELKNGRVFVVAALRSDFMGHCLGIATLASRFKTAVEVILPTLAEPQLRDAIRRPALRLGVTIERAVEDAMIKSVVGAPGRLPLMQYALKLLWDRRDRQQGRMTWATYQALGELEGALAMVADKALADMPPLRREIARRVFLRLVHPGAGTGDTRRRVPLSEFEGDRDAQEVVLQLSRAGLLVTNASQRIGDGLERETTAPPVVEISHEALIHAWSTLQRWLAKDRRSRQLLHELAGASHHYHRHGCQSDDLWRGSRLQHAEELDQAGDWALNQQERHFLEASLTARNTEHARAEEARMTRMKQEASAREARLKALKTEQRLAEAERSRAESEALQARRSALWARWIAAVVLVLVVAVGLAWGRALSEAEQARIAEGEAKANAERALQARASSRRSEKDARVAAGKAREAATQARRHEAQLWSETGRRALVTGHPLKSALYLLRALELEEPQSIATRFLLGAAVRDVERMQQEFPIKGESIRSVTASSDGKLIALGTVKGSVQLWDGPSTLSLKGLRETVAWLQFGQGNRLVGRGTAGTAVVWDAETAQVLVELSRQAPEIKAAKWSPNGRFLVTTHADGQVRRWDPEGKWSFSTLMPSRIRTARKNKRAGGVEGSLISTADRDRADAYHVVGFSANGTRLAAGGQDRVVVWDLESGVKLWERRHRRGKLSAVALDPLGDRVLTGYADASVELYDVGTRKAPIQFRPHQEPISSAAFSSDGAYILTAGRLGAVRLSRADGTHLVTLRCQDSGTTTASFSPDDRIVTGCEEGQARLWSISKVKERWWSQTSETTRTPQPGMLRETKSKTMKVRTRHRAHLDATLEGHRGRINALAFSPDGSSMFTASEDATAKRWDLKSTNPIAVVEGHEAAVTALALDPGGAFAATADARGGLRFWALDSGHSYAVHADHRGAIRAVALSDDGKLLATVGADGAARLWATQSGARVASLEGSGEPLLAVAISADGSRVATAEEWSAVRVWDGPEYRQSKRLDVCEAPLGDVRFSPDGRLVAVAAYDRTVKVYDVDTGNLQHDLTHTSSNDASVYTVRFSPDGRLLGTAGEAREAKLWDVVSGRPLAQLRHDDQVNVIRFSADGALIVTASNDRTAKIWAAPTGDHVASLQGHTSAVNAAAFDPTGERVATAGADGSVRIWHPGSGRPLAVLRGHTKAVVAVEFSADGRQLVSAGSDNTARVWNVAPGDLGMRELVDRRSPWKLHAGALVEK